MAEQDQNVCLLKMPLLVIDRILSNIPNPSNISRTCRCLYEIVCDVEKRRRVMYIRWRLAATTRFTIDDDAVFDSIMNTHRTIEEIKMDVGYYDSVMLNELQMERMTAIMKRFGANITSFKIRGIDNSILEWLHHVPKLETLTLAEVSFMDLCTKKANLRLPVLSSLQLLEPFAFVGPADIADLIPAGSLNYFRYVHHGPTPISKAILTKQANIKFLHFQDQCAFGSADLTVLCVNHLQLETLIIESRRKWTEDKLLEEILKCHMNLKELRLPGISSISDSAFEWICNNLKQLEVFEVCLLERQGKNPFEMLGKLKKLRHFRTQNYDLIAYGFQFKGDSLDKLEIDIGFLSGERLNNFVHSMVQSFPNLTHLTMDFDDFCALTFLLSHCTTLTHLTSEISDPSSDKLAQQPQLSFPNMQHLDVSIECNMKNAQYNEMGASMILIVQAMTNLKSLSMSMWVNGVMFDVNLMKQIVKVSKNLDHLSMYSVELDPNLSIDELVETIRYSWDQLKVCEVKFDSASRGELKWRTVKEILSKEFCVQNNRVNDLIDDRVDHPLPFCLCKGAVKKYYCDL